MSSWRQRILKPPFLLLLTFGFSQDYSFSFDGVDDYIMYNLPADLTIPSNNATYECWFNANDIQSLQVIMFMGGSWNAWLYINEGYLQFHQDSWSINDDIKINISNNQWYHAAVTYANSNPTLITLWLNGLKIEEKSHTVPTNWDSQLLVGFSEYDIVAHHNYLDNLKKFNGLISSLKISNEVLFDEQFELSTNFSSDESTFLLWDFNQNSASLVVDQTGNGNDGTIQGDPEYSNDVPVLGCTDPVAENYNSDADFDDGSCTYPDNGDYSLSFDGEDDWVDLSYDFNILEFPITISTNIAIPDSDIPIPISGYIPPPPLKPPPVINNCAPESHT